MVSLFHPDAFRAELVAEMLVGRVVEVDHVEVLGVSVRGGHPPGETVELDVSRGRSHVVRVGEAGDVDADGA